MALFTEIPPSNEALGYADRGSDWGQKVGEKLMVVLGRTAFDKYLARANMWVLPMSDIYLSSNDLKQLVKKVDLRLANTFNEFEWEIVFSYYRTLYSLEMLLMQLEYLQTMTSETETTELPKATSLKQIENIIFSMQTKFTQSTIVNPELEQLKESFDFVLELLSGAIRAVGAHQFILGNGNLTEIVGKALFHSKTLHHEHIAATVEKAFSDIPTVEQLFAEKRKKASS